MNAYLINTETMQWPIYEGNYRLDNPNVSFPEVLEPIEPYAWVKHTVQPEYDVYTQRIDEITPVNVNGVWKRQWKIIDLDGKDLEDGLQKKTQEQEALRNNMFVTMRQARLQLIAQDLYDVVNEAVSAMPQTAQVEWEYATEVRRSNPLVQLIQQHLKWTDIEVDKFFASASEL